MNHSSCTKSRTRSLPEREESFSKAHKCLLTCPLPFVRLCISRSTSRKKATLKEDHQQGLCFLLCFFLLAPCPVMEPLASSHGLGPSTTDASRCTWSPGRPHCAPWCLFPEHCPLGRAQDTARGQLGGSQEFGRQSCGAYQWALVRLGIPELLSHVFAGNYKSPCRAFCTARGFATLGPLQFCLLCK